MDTYHIPANVRIYVNTVFLAAYNSYTYMAYNYCVQNRSSKGKHKNAVHFLHNHNDVNVSPDLGLLLYIIEPRPTSGLIRKLAFGESVIVTRDSVTRVSNTNN
jgi:hypothetical protein